VCNLQHVWPIQKNKYRRRKLDTRVSLSRTTRNRVGESAHASSLASRNQAKIADFDAFEERAQLLPNSTPMGESPVLHNSQLRGES
jgi:hypothetical protein